MESLQRLYKMNTQNAMRHVIAKSRRALRSGCDSHVYSAYRMIIEVDPSALRCTGCPHEDFGYCGLRNSSMSWEKIQQECCIPAFIRKFDK